MQETLHNKIVPKTKTFCLWQLVRAQPIITIKSVIFPSNYMQSRYGVAIENLVSPATLCRLKSLLSSVLSVES